MLKGLSRLLQPRVEALGLEVGASQLKLVELSGQPPVLKGYAIRPTPPGLLAEGKVNDPATLAQEIRELLAEARTRKRYVVTAAPNAAVILRTLQVPKMPPKEMEQAVRWEAERYIPYPLDEAILDFAPLTPPEEVPEGGQVEVMIGVVRQETIMGLLEALRLAGLVPIAVDVKPFAGLYPLESRLLEDPEAYTLAIEVGAESTSLVLLKGERPLAVRILTLAGKDFTEALARAFGLDPIQAEEIKRNYGLATLPTEDESLLLDFDLEREQFNPGRVYDALRPVLVDLTQEVKRSLDFFRISLGEVQPEVGYLFGGGGKLRGLVGLLNETLGIPFEPVNPWARLNVDPRRFDLEALTSMGPEFMVPVGLALRGVEPLD